MILPIYVYGQPVLRKVAQDITPDYPELKELIQNMFETMDNADGIGLAAPQIGRSIRLSVIDLSIPGIHENVDRRTRIHVKWMDEEFTEHDEWIEGYLARVMQHEFDHLDGVLFTDRISPLRKQLVKNKLTAMSKGKYRAAYRTKAAQR